MDCSELRFLTIVQVECVYVYLSVHAAIPVVIVAHWIDPTRVVVVYLALLVAAFNVVKRQQSIADCVFGIERG